MENTLIENAVAKFNLTDATISELAEKYGNAVIEGLDDKDGYRFVKEGEASLRGYRVQVEKTRKGLKAEALTYGRVVDAEAKRITALLTPLEWELKRKRSEIDQAKLKAKLEAERLASLPDRLADLGLLGVEMSDEAVLAMDDNVFRSHLLNLKEEIVEAKRVEQEAREEKIRSAEAKILRAEEDKALEEKAEAKAKADAAQAIKDAEEAKEKAEADAIQAKADAEKDALQAIEDAAAKVRLAAAEKAEAEEAEKKRLAAIEAARPDLEKVEAFANALLFTKMPEVSDEKAKDILERLFRCLKTDVRKALGECMAEKK